ncbi:MAG TPA: hypothetical protein V6C65_40970 [Allocoleopsis sp.]
MGNKIVLINWTRIGVAVLWWFEETSYFGWNAAPHSLAELFADGLTLALWASAFRVESRSMTDG